MNSETRTFTICGKQYEIRIWQDADGSVCVRAFYNDQPASASFCVNSDVAHAFEWYRSLSILEELVKIVQGELSASSNNKD